MPNQRTHRTITTTCAALSAASLLYLPFDSFLFFEAGILVTLLPEFTPDLDISIRKFSALQEFIGLRAYARAVPHRYGARPKHWKELVEEQKYKSFFERKHWSRLRVWNIFFFSHLPFIGTLLRTFLLCLPLALLAMLLWKWLGPTLALWLPVLPVYFLWLWLGMSWSDCWHVAADRPWSKHGDKKEMSRDYWYGKKQTERRLYRKSKVVE